MRLVETQDVAVAIILVVQVFGDDHPGDRQQRRRVGRGADKDMLIRQCPAGHGPPGVDTDDTGAVLFRPFEVLHRASAEGSVTRAPAPHHDQLRIDIIGWLPPGGLVLGLGAVGHMNRENLRLGRHVGPEIGAAAKHVQEPLRGHPPMQHRLRAGTRRVQDRGVPMLRLHTAQFRRDGGKRFIP